MSEVIEVAQKPLARGHKGQARFDRPAKTGEKKARFMADGSVDPFPRERFLKFCSKLKIQSRDFGLIDFQMLGSQEYLLDEICAGLAEGVTMFVILKNRQAGISTFFLALDLFWAFEYPGTLGVFATHEEASREQFRAQIDLYIATLPKGYKVGVTTSNRIMLVLKNASLFRYLVAGQKTTTNKLGRSGGTNYAHLTEIAFWGSPEDITALFQTFSHLYKHRAYFIESTANGFNHYEEMYQTALASPSQRAIFIGWWRDERNEFGEAHPSYKHYMPAGTKTPLTQREKKGIREVRELYDFTITAGQIAWYRWHLENNCSGDQGQMDQEQPWTAEDAFQSTGSKFFTGEALTEQFRQAKKALCKPFMVRMTDRWQDIEVRPIRDPTMANLKIWQDPSPWGKYVLGVDVAYGSSPNNDSTVISVLRVWADRAEQVAEYHSPETSTYQCAWMVAYLAGLYRDCMVNIETTGPGMVVLQELDRLRKDAIDMVGPDGADLRNVFARMREFLYRRPDSLSGGVVRQWQTTQKTKAYLMDRFRNVIELGMAHLKSLSCIDECRRLTRDGDNIEADTGHDDRAIAAALACWAWMEFRMGELKSKKWTYEHAQQVEQQGGEQPMDGLMRRFLALKKIQVKDADARNL